MKTRAETNLELRPATFADVGIVVDLESARTPDDPRDTAMLGFWWTVHPPAREGDAIVGLSAIEYPMRGFEWTAFTATARTARGRGIARALKYETVVQAMGFGVERVRTNNDGQNAPILHINAEMGYVPIEAALEMHRELLS